jgi:tetratricopeptide (TPR) repeat protein
MKKLSIQLQPYHEVVRVIEEIHEEHLTKKKGNTRVLGHVISYALYQFGDRTLGKPYRERAFNGERIDNWLVEIVILIPMYLSLFSIYHEDESLSLMDYDNLVFSHQEKILELLRPWSAYLDVSSASHIDSLDKDQINGILTYLSQAERNMGSIYIRRSQFDLAENHCQQGLIFAKLYEGKEEDKTDLIFSALSTSYEFHTYQGNYEEALTYAEEAYDCVAVAYNPVHPEVQTAASTLIECLILKGDFDQAETFAQMTLDSLKDPGNGLDQQSEAVANGFHDLGKAISKQERDYVKAEKLVRESLRIRTRLYDTHHRLVGATIGLLARILSIQGRLGSETLELLERALAIDIRNYGSEGINTAISNYNLGNFYNFRAEESQTAEAKKYHMQLSESKYKESLRIYSKIYGPDHPSTIRASSALSSISCKLSET